MNGLSTDTVSHANTERAGWTLVVRFSDKEAKRRFQKGVETFFCRKVSGIARHSRPIKRRCIYGVMPWFALHERQLTAHIITDSPQFLLTLCPCHNIAMATDGNQPVTVRFIQIHVNPVFVYLVGTAVSWKRLHIACGLFKMSQVIVAVIHKDILVHNVVAGK